jgi:hypothetical protein
MFVHGFFNGIACAAAAAGNTAFIAVKVGDGIHGTFDVPQIVKVRINLFGHAAVNQITKILDELIDLILRHRFQDAVHRYQVVHRDTGFSRHRLDLFQDRGVHAGKIPVIQQFLDADTGFFGQFGDGADLLIGHIVASRQVLDNGIADHRDLRILRQAAQVTDRDEGHLVADNDKDIVAGDAAGFTTFLCLVDQPVNLVRRGTLLDPAIRSENLALLECQRLCLGDDNKAEEGTRNIEFHKKAP